MQNMYSVFNPQFHREQLMNAYNQMLNAQQYQYPQLQQNNPAIMGYSIFPVSNIEEANATKADMNYNPTFFFNQSQGEIYLKQLDRNTNAATMRYFKEVKPEHIQVPSSPVKQSENINQYAQQLNTILEGINGLYRLLSQPQEISTVNTDLVDVNVENIKPARGIKNAK